MRFFLLAGVSFAMVGCGSVVVDASAGGAGTTGTVAAATVGHAVSVNSGSTVSSSSASVSEVSSTGSSVSELCVASSFLSHDSFDVVAEAVDKCLNQGTGCPVHTVSTVSLPNLAEGNGDVTFDYSTDADGTHSLIGHGNPDAAAAPPGIILEAHQIPAPITLDLALERLYLMVESFDCTWQ